MKVQPLYRVRFTYPQGWELALLAPSSTEGQHFYLAEGPCEGRTQGKFRGANHPGVKGMVHLNPISKASSKRPMEL